MTREKGVNAIKFIEQTQAVNSVQKLPPRVAKTLRASKEAQAILTTDHNLELIKSNLPLCDT
ncbi:hypothetical protein [Terracidiphilus sp.]|uniref:hypothetical protein n=1 Tax=Terracidiphilus sp. TaxID=1964191 RepID=UPI003C23DE65